MAKQTKKRTRKVFPLPGQVGRGPWSILPSDQPRVNLRDKKLWVNLSDDPQWATTRAHELGHIKWTPITKHPKDVDEFTIQAVEDMRINTLLRKAGVDLSAGGPQHIIESAALGTSKDLRLMTLIWIADLRGANEDAQIAAYWPGDNPLRHKASRIVAYAHHYLELRRLHFTSDPIGAPIGRSKPFTFKRTIAIAQWLDRLFRDGIGKDEEGDTDPTDMTTADGSEYTKGLTEKWGVMRMEYPTLHADKALRHIRYAEEGASLRAPWRRFTDGKLFRAINRAKKQGTILIDGSGSMSLDADNVQAFTKAAPLGKVAAYHGDNDLNEGPLRLLADKGKLATDSKAFKFGGGNVVDGPALQWLGQQSKPRIWVCDGRVTGPGDQSSTACSREANRLMRQYGILRFDNCEKAQAYLQTGRGTPDRTTGF